MMLGLLAMVLVAMLLFPEMPAGRALRLLLVDRPAAWLFRLKPARVLVQGGLIAFVVALLLIARDSDLGVLIVQMLPELLAWLVAIDAITVLEVAVAIWLVSSNARVRAAARVARLVAWRLTMRCVSWIGARWRMARGRTQRPALRRPRLSNSKDDDRPADALAFGLG